MSPFRRRKRAAAIGAPKKRSKYNAIKTVVDNITFDSKAEAKRYGELKLMERAGKLHELRVHTRWPLFSQKFAAALNSVTALVGSYESDFDYLDEFRIATVIEDVKGVMTPIARWKIKHFEIQYGIKVKIIK